MSEAENTYSPNAYALIVFRPWLAQQTLPFSQPEVIADSLLGSWLAAKCPIDLNLTHVLQPSGLLISLLTNDHQYCFREAIVRWGVTSIWTRKVYRISQCVKTC